MMKWIYRKDYRNLSRAKGKSCSMDIGGITPEYAYRMWGGMVPLDDIKEELMVQDSRFKYKSQR